MRGFLVSLLFLLVACIPQAESDFNEDFFNGDYPVWQADFEGALQVAVAALQPFSETQKIQISTVGSDTSRRKIRELESDWLEKNRLIVLLELQGDRLVVVVLDLANKKRTILEPRSLGETLNKSLTNALDGRYKRTVL